MFNRWSRGRAAAWIGVLALPLLAAVAQGAGPDGYLDQDDLDRELESLAASSSMCTLGVLAETGDGRRVHLLTLAADPTGAGERPALLITAGLDGRHLVGTETAVRVARSLVDEHAALLEQMTVYVVPRANPDGAALRFATPLGEHAGNLRPVDDDRDGVADEDGPVDLDGDGLITMMRRIDPPLDDEPTHVADPVEPRLLQEPAPAKGEAATYAVYTEGTDQDGDGRIAEDGRGMVDLDRNFMHEWPEHALDAGAYQLSEPESLALARFVLEHRNIVAALTYGRHDNLINVPDGKGSDVSGRGPKVLDSDDVALYKEIGRLFEETTGQQRAPERSVAGSFHAWLYAQRGLPSFATVVWGRPDPAKKEAEEETPETEQEDDDATDAEQDDRVDLTGAWDGSATIGEMGEVPFTLTLEHREDGTVTGQLGSQMFTIELEGSFDADSGRLSMTGGVGESTIEYALQLDENVLAGTATVSDGQVIDMSVERDAEAGGDGRGGGDDKPADAESAAWLTYSDEQRDGAGFVDWTPFDHPILGAVEIGGFVPGFRMNPPSEALDELAAKQLAFVVELMERHPRLTFVGPQVEPLAEGLYEVRFGIVNEGFLPTSTAMARKARSFQPLVVRLSLEPDRIVAGDRVSRVWGIDGGGGRFAGHWIVRAESPAAITVEVESTHFGKRRLTAPPQESTP